MTLTSTSPAPISYLNTNLIIPRVNWLSPPWTPQRQHMQNGTSFPITNLCHFLNIKFHLTVPHSHLLETETLESFLFPSILIFSPPRVTKVWKYNCYNVGTICLSLTTSIATTLIQTTINYFLGCVNGFLTSMPVSSLYGCCITDIVINWKLERNWWWWYVVTG